MEKVTNASPICTTEPLHMLFSLPGSSCPASYLTGSRGLST